MIKIEFNEKTYNIPSEWKDITMANYERWFNHVPDDKMDHVRFVADICKIDYDELLNSPTQFFDTLVEHIRFLFDTESGIEPSNHIKIDGKEYYIALADKLTLGEWVDIENVMESESGCKISETLAVVCRPLGEDYDADRVEERKELFRMQSCNKILPLITFFLRRKRQSEEILSHYSAVVEQAARFVEDTKTFVANGDGIKQLPIWQRIKYRFLIRSLKKRLSKFSAFYSIG